jgi:ubiquinone/menaquinone biosynthesis C-methylase UbiE
MDTNNLKPCPICSGSRVRHERYLNNGQLIRCEICSFVYANLTDEYIKVQNSDFGELAAVSYQESQTLADELWFKRIVKRVGKTIRGGSILDVGCGNGLLLKSFIEKGWKACGMDLSPWAEQFAQRYGFKLYRCELEKSELPDNCFDAVTGTSTLEHIPQPYLHIKEILRVLKPGGIAYFSGMPNYGSLSVRLGISDFRNNQPPKHVNYFTCGSMHKLLSRPEIADKMKTISVSTYGIPELHKLYGLLRNAVVSSKPAVKTNSLNDNHPLSKSSKSSLAAATTGIIVALNYYSGKLFHLGDKIEVIITKQQ